MSEPSCKWCIHSESRERWNRVTRKIEKCTWCNRHEMMVYNLSKPCKEYNEEAGNE